MAARARAMDQIVVEKVEKGDRQDSSAPRVEIG
jgi:hypothetical protein